MNFSVWCKLQTFLEYIPGRNDWKDPVKYFLFLAFTLDTTLAVLTFKILWLNQQEILDILNFLRNGVDVPTTVTRLLSPILVGFLQFLYIGTGNILWLFDEKAFTAREKDGTFTWTVAGWWHAMVDYGWGYVFHGICQEFHDCRNSRWSSLFESRFTNGNPGSHWTIPSVCQLIKF